MGNWYQDSRVCRNRLTESLNNNNGSSRLKDFTGITNKLFDSLISLVALFPFVPHYGQILKQPIIFHALK